MAEPILYIERAGHTTVLISCVTAGILCVLCLTVIPVPPLIVFLVIAPLTLSLVGWQTYQQKMRSVILTPQSIQFAQETLELSRVVTIDAPMRADAQILGGWKMPSDVEIFPLKLSDGSTVVGWTKNAEKLRLELRKLLDSRPMPDIG